MGWQGINQRQFPRISCKCHLNLICDGEEKEIEAYTENIGKGGVCVVLEEDLGLFKAVSVRMMVPGQKNGLNCRGEVVWVVKKRPVNVKNKVLFDTGIEFRDMTDEDSAFIEQILNNIIPNVS
ncbi:MAG: PilZ domain-containing protein [Candidatus Omnitrophica bacterium]|nr:PilZ domain-containing protein [Candidatus Omnitrophota bacterium]